MARARNNVHDATILEMALVGYQVELDKLDGRIQEIQSLLKGKQATPASHDGASGHTPRKRNLSDAARARIAAAQRKRWAQYRKQEAQSKSA